jgi:hypothetical protein
LLSRALPLANRRSMIPKMLVLSGTSEQTTVYAGLPSWGTALPLWAADAWLWIELSPTGQVRAAGTGPPSEEPALDGSYSIIVLDCSATGSIPAAWWPRLGRAVLPGGVLFICGLRDMSLHEQIALGAPDLRPSTWHVIEPHEDGAWRLRPDTRPIALWIDSHLAPPYGLRTWLRQIFRRWMPSAPRVACLPVWHEASR